MSIRLKIFLFVIWALILVFLFIKMKAEKADIRFIVPWIILDIVMAVITAVPSILTVFCTLLGIETPSNMLFFFGMIFLCMIVFSMSLTISAMHEEIRKLTQKTALLECQCQKGQHPLTTSDPEGESQNGKRVDDYET